MLLKDLIYLFIEERAGHYSQRTLNIYFNNLKEFYAWNKNKQVEEIGQEDIDKFILRIECRGYRNSTIKGYLHSLKTFFEFCKKYNFKNKFFYNFSRYPLDPLKINFIYKKDFNKIIDNIFHAERRSELKEAPVLLIRDLAIIQILIETGIAVAEISRLKMEDINLDKKVIFIREKNRPDRHLVISRDTVDLIEKVISFRDDTKGYLFCRLDRAAYVQNNITPRSVERLVKGYSNGKFSPKDFRHTFIMLKLLKKRGVYEVSDLVGGTSDCSKTAYRKEILKLEKEVKITRKDYNAYEYLKNRYGKLVLDILCLGDRQKFSFDREMKLKIL
jgi:integrase/recombinase XerC